MEKQVEKLSRQVDRLRKVKDRLLESLIEVEDWMVFNDLDGKQITELKLKMQETIRIAGKEE